jgi:peptide/nickel transport system permease protein
MGTFLARRSAQAVTVLFGVAVLTFALTRLLPGGVARAVLGPKATEIQIAAFNHQNGFDQSAPVQFIDYLGRLAHFDLGFSYTLNQSVASLIGQALPKTLLLVGLAYLVAVTIAIPIGILQAARRNSLLDHGLTVITLVLYAMPVFWLGLILTYVFAVELDVLPSQAPSGSIGDVLADPAGLVLPVASLALIMIALFSRYVRSAAIDNLVQEYVTTARAKGASERRILFGHVLRNALLPVITILGYSLPLIISSALIVEVLFNFPGMGLLLWNAATTRDYPVLLGCALVVGVFTVLGNLLADILYAAVDPRIRLS